MFSGCRFWLVTGETMADVIIDKKEKTGRVILKTERREVGCRDSKYLVARGVKGLGTRDSQFVYPMTINKIHA